MIVEDCSLYRVLCQRVNGWAAGRRAVLAGSGGCGGRGEVCGVVAGVGEDGGDGVGGCWW
jgi:hypothetical protein